MSERYKVDIKITIKKFYKWLLGNNRVYPELVEWIDTYQEPKEISALTELEVQRLVDRCKTSLQRALVQVLFDGGLRISELLNVRLRHVQFRNFDPADPTKQCFFLRIPFSKTLRRTVALPMHATTKWLSMWLEDHPLKPVIQPDGTVMAKDMSCQLFPMTDNAVRLIVRRVGQRALGKRVYTPINTRLTTRLNIYTIRGLWSADPPLIYLEWYCLRQCKEVGRFEIENTARRTERTVPDSIKDESLDAYDTMNILLSALGYPLFEPIRTSPDENAHTSYCRVRTRWEQESGPTTAL